MIVIKYPYGRLGNQLELAAHLITYANKKNRTVSLLYFSKFSDAFPYFENNPICAYPKKFFYYKSIYGKLIKYALSKSIVINRIPKIDFLEKNQWIYYDNEAAYENKEFKKLNESLICEIKVWRFRSTELIKKYRALIKEIFTPNIAVLEDAKKQRKLVGCEVVIGVHIRWGDYKTEAPESYHDIEVYKDKMIEAVKLFKNKTVGFIVCTEEKIEFDTLNELKCVYPKKDAITDLYTLAHCDYIIGAASTFSQWASYWGEVGLFIIYDKSIKIEKISQFEICDLVPKNIS